jgi:hypothetical protein
MQGFLLFVLSDQQIYVSDINHALKHTHRKAEYRLLGIARLKIFIYPYGANEV